MAQDSQNRLSKKQAILLLLWLPIQGLLLPFLAAFPLEAGLIDTVGANLLVYAVGALAMLLILWRLFRRDFDPLCDHWLATLLLVFGGYLMANFGTNLVSLLLQALGISASNANNDAVIALLRENAGPMIAMSVILAPLVEESLFRVGIFGLLRRKSRVLAYLGSALLFGLWHTWSSALVDPSQLLFSLQYLPSALVLAYTYERTDSVWGCVFLHMLINGVAVLSLLRA